MINRDVNDCGPAVAIDDLTPEQESHLASSRHGT